MENQEEGGGIVYIWLIHEPIKRPVSISEELKKKSLQLSLCTSFFLHIIYISKFIYSKHRKRHNQNKKKTFTSLYVSHCNNNNNNRIIKRRD